MRRSLWGDVDEEHVPGQLALVDGRPRLLDLFCGAGGASMGYARAGWDVTGVDLHVQPRYPFLTIEQADALDVLRDVEYLRTFHAVHASPPCQPYSRRLRHMAHPVDALIPRVRELLVASGVPWVIENVVGAEPYMPGHVVVCGTGLGLRVQRHRLFEASVPLVGTVCDHSAPPLNPGSQEGRDRMYREYGRGDPDRMWQQHVGLEWCNRYEAREAVPPVTTTFVGGQLIEALGYSTAPPASSEAGGAG